MSDKAVAPPSDPPSAPMRPEQVQLLIDTSQALCAYVDSDERYQMCNKAYAGRMSLEPKDFIGRTIREMLGEDAYAIMEPYIRAALAGHTVKYEKVIPYAHLGDRQVAVTYVPDRDAQQRVRGFAVSLLDITMRVYVEEALRQSEAHLQAVVNTAVEGIITIDSVGHLQSMNIAASRTFGYTPEEAIGKNVSMLMPEPYHSEHDGYLAHYLTTGEKRIIGIGREVMGRRKDGTTFPMDLAVSEFTLADKRFFVGIVRDITERKRAEADLRESEERFRATFEQAAVGIALVSLEGTWLRVNQRFCNIVGYTREEIRDRTFQDITHPEDLETDLNYVQRLLANTLDTYTIEKRYIQKSGGIAWVNLTASLVREPSGEPNYFITVIEDISERKRIEEQLQHAQRLESIGQLAGGIAHDFNNLLTAITGFTELAMGVVTDNAEATAYLSNVTHAAERAAGLTRQLLAFARKQMIEPKILDINVLLLQLDKILRRLIGENIDLVLMPQMPLWEVRVDPSQIEQVIINLAVNARDAMPGGGSLTIETHKAVLDTEYSRQYAEVLPGEYVMVAISDTGTGMTEEVKRHVFEPFFTTKEPGRGTGLGLATCYGIVKQSGGHMWFYSEPNKGSTFKIYLPRAVGAATFDVEAIYSQPGGDETILIVEDEPLVRGFAVQILRDQGYTILEASHGKEALSVAAAHNGPIHLLLTDVVMPQLGGKPLADMLQKIRPEMKTLYSSGYTDNAIVHHGTLDEGVAFLQKPYTSLSLTRKVREVLDTTVT